MTALGTGANRHWAYTLRCIEAATWRSGRINTYAQSAEATQSVFLQYQALSCLIEGLQTPTSPGADVPFVCRMCSDTVAVSKAASM